MNDKERIDRLEGTILILVTKLKEIVQVVNTGSYNYELNDIEFEFKDSKQYRDKYYE